MSTKRDLAVEVVAAKVYDARQLARGELRDVLTWVLKSVKEYRSNNQVLKLLEPALWAMGVGVTTGKFSTRTCELSEKLLQAHKAIEELLAIKEE